MIFVQVGHEKVEFSTVGPVAQKKSILIKPLEKMLRGILARRRFTNGMDVALGPTPERDIDGKISHPRHGSKWQLVSKLHPDCIPLGIYLFTDGFQVSEWGTPSKNSMTGISFGIANPYFDVQTEQMSKFLVTVVPKDLDIIEVTKKAFVEPLLALRSVGFETLL